MHSLFPFGQAGSFFFGTKNHGTRVCSIENGFRLILQRLDSDRLQKILMD